MISNERNYSYSCANHSIIQGKLPFIVEPIRASFEHPVQISSDNKINPIFNFKCI